MFKHTSLSVPKIFLTVALGLAVVPLLVSASTVVRTGGSIGVAQDQVVNGDFYALGESVTLSGQVVEDFLAAGARVILNGEIGGDALIAGATVDINGPIGDDLRVVGTAVSIAGEVSGNVVVVAQTLKILSTANIKGDVLFYGGSAEIAGTVGRDILGRSERLRIDGLVEGTVDVRTLQLTLGDRANITGNVRYESAREIVRSPNATVVGSITRSDLDVPQGTDFAGFVIVFLVSLFSGLVLYLLLPAFLRRVAWRVLNHPLRSSLLGFGSLIILPIASLALFVSTLGLVLGGLLLASFVVVLLGSYALSGVVTGVLLASLFRKPAELSILWIVAGTFVLHMTMAVPIIGSTLVVGLVIIVFGAVVDVVVRQLRNV